MLSQEQTQAFAEAMKCVVHDIDEDMLALDFSQMMRELKQAIQNLGRSDSVRFFSRHCLKMKGDRYKEVGGWISGRLAMSADDIICVLRALKKLREEGLDVIVPKEFAQSFRREDSQTESVTSVTSGLNRRIIDHAIGTFHSIASIVVEADIRPEYAYDSDRMDIQDAMQKLCDRFGITVNFPTVETVFSQRLTRKDLKEIGFQEGNKKEKQ